MASVFYWTSWEVRSSNLSALLFFVCQFLFFSLSPFEWDSILFPSVRVLISSSPTPELFAFSFRRSRRHHHTYIYTYMYTTNWNRVCMSTRHERKRNFENQLLIHIEIVCWSPPSQIKHHVKLSVNSSSFLSTYCSMYRIFEDTYHGTQEWNKDKVH
jgi:hypothetical protein